LHYFLQLNHDAHRPLVIWGAGTKGKHIAKALKARNITFYWLCDNPKKIGKSIYHIPMLHYHALADLDNPQSIITVANEESQVLIRAFLTNLDHKPMLDYFFFC